VSSRSRRVPGAGERPEQVPTGRRRGTDHAVFSCRRATPRYGRVRHPRRPRGRTARPRAPRPELPGRGRRGPGQPPLLPARRDRRRTRRAGLRGGAAGPPGPARPRHVRLAGPARRHPRRPPRPPRRVRRRHRRRGRARRHRRPRRRRRPPAGEHADVRGGTPRGEPGSESRDRVRPDAGAGVRRLRQRRVLGGPPLARLARGLPARDGRLRGARDGDRIRGQHRHRGPGVRRAGDDGGRWHQGHGRHRRDVPPRREGRRLPARGDRGRAVPPGRGLSRGVRPGPRGGPVRQPVGGQPRPHRGDARRARRPDHAGD